MTFSQELHAQAKVWRDQADRLQIQLGGMERRTDAQRHARKVVEIQIETLRKCSRELLATSKRVRAGKRGP